MANSAKTQTFDQQTFGRQAFCRQAFCRQAFCRQAFCRQAFGRQAFGQNSYDPVIWTTDILPTHWSNQSLVFHLTNRHLTNITFGQLSGDLVIWP
jgi:hypothetical protein